VAAGAGLLTVVVLFFAGPGLFGDGAAPQGSVVQAKVTRSMDCTQPDAQESVTFPLGGTTRDGTLNGCGHNKGEEVAVMVPADPGSGAITVETSKVINGSSSARRPIGLFLIALSCFAGAYYAHLVIRGPRDGAKPPGKLDGKPKLNFKPKLKLNKWEPKPKAKPESDSEPSSTAAEA
jgi:hypothetical protein